MSLGSHTNLFKVILRSSFCCAIFNFFLNIRYLQSWISHGLLVEYYDESAFLRSLESSLLPGLAAGNFTQQLTTLQFT